MEITIKRSFNFLFRLLRNGCKMVHCALIPCNVYNFRLFVMILLLLITHMPITFVDKNHLYGFRQNRELSYIVRGQTLNVTRSVQNGSIFVDFLGKFSFIESYTQDLNYSVERHSGSVTTCKIYF